MVRKWDPVTETLVVMTDPDEESRIRGNKQELDRFLGVFPYETWKKWYSLTTHVSEEVIKNVEPLSKILCSASQLELDEKQEKHGAAGSSSDEDRMLPKMHIKAGTEMRFTPLPSAQCLEKHISRI